MNVRGTPASGKSVLASLLHAHYLAREKPTILLRGWRKAPRENGTDFLIREARVMGYTIARPFIENADLVIILDDGQTSYDDLFFWLSLVKSQSMNRFGARICIFTSYGSPRSGPVEKIGYTLAFLGPQQRVSITPSNVRFSPEISLFYTREEFNDVVTRFCRNPSLLRLDSSAHDYTFELTNGQPGAVDAVLRMLEKVSSRTGLSASIISDHTIYCRCTVDNSSRGKQSTKKTSSGLLTTRTLSSSLVKRVLFHPAPRSPHKLPTSCAKC